MPDILPIHPAAGGDWSRPTVGLVLDWYRTNNPTPSTCAVAEAERQRIWATFGKLCGHMAVADCRAHQLLTFLNSFPSLRSAWSRRRWANTVNRPFNLAAQLGLVGRNPFRGVPLPEGNPGRDWTDEEYRRLLRASPPEVRRLIVFLRFSGARPGEMRVLTRAAVLPGQIILAEHKAVRATGKPRRIFLNAPVAKLLAWLLRRHPGAECLFLNSHGRPWTRGALDKRLRELRRKAGVSEKVKLHGLRHTFATRAVMNGVDIATLAQLLGHERVHTTERYTHLAGKHDHLTAAAEKAVRCDNRRR